MLNSNYLTDNAFEAICELNHLTVGVPCQTAVFLETGADTELGKSSKRNHSGTLVSLVSLVSSLLFSLS